MKDILKFVFRLSLFSLLTLITLETLGALIYKSGIHRNLWAGKEVYFSLSKCKKNNNYRTLLLGDSVANQLFNQKKYNKNPNSLACVEPIGLIGNYLLLKKYLGAGNDIDTCILLLHPYGFANNLDQKYTYNYFLKPFYNKEYRKSFSEKVKERISLVPYNQLLFSKFVRTSRWSPNYSDEINRHHSFISSISIEYLSLIKELSIKENFVLRIVSPPLSEDMKEKVLSYDRKEYANTSFENEMNHYFETFFFVDRDHFADQSHYKKEYMNFYEEKMRTKLGI